MMSVKFENTLNDLSKNPMFRLSLGSKELFHSNFLAVLWEQNHEESFLNMIDDLLPEDRKINVSELLKKEGLTLYREKNNLDISIRHTENDKEIIDIVIENKVKSIPYEEQLQKYEDKVKKNPKDISATYILLTLANKFPNQEAIKKEWSIITYTDLAKKIEEYYGGDKIVDKLQQYVTDYIKFINLLGDLNILENFENNPFHNDDEIKKFHEIKLSDLYLKQRGSYFICLLHERLIEELEKIDVKLGERAQASGKKVTETPNNTIIYLSSGMNRGKSTITIHIYPKKRKSSYALQIEGNQYRHMFVQEQLVKRRDKVLTTLEKMPNFFDVTNLPVEVINLPEKIEKKEEWDGTKDFNQYKPDCLYKYVTYPQETTGAKMLEIVVEDVKKVLGYLNECNKIAKEIQKIT